MMNKKILAVALATVFSTNALAVQSLQNPTVAVVIASEFVTSAPTLDVTNLSGENDSRANTGSDLDISSTYGFSIGAGTSKYLRIELTNATFLSQVLAADFLPANSGESFSVSAQGAPGDDFVIIEVAAGASDVNQSDVWNFAAPSYEISQTDTASVLYTLHDTAADAVNDESPLATENGLLANVAAVTSGVFTTPLDSTATVASAFKAFDSSISDAVSATIGLVGSIDTDLFITGAGFLANGDVVIPSDLVTAGQDVTFTGDMSFGDWSTATAADCVENATPLLGEDADGADPLTVADVTAELFLCVTVDTSEIINKGSYSAFLVTDDLTNAIGVISYDTTSIEVPYLTTFSGYNQRLYMTNTSGSDAAYSITFVAEGVTVVTPLAAASGIIPKGEMIALKARDIVQLDNRTRTSAVIEVELVDEDVTATTQSVNIDDGSTDTTVLN